MDQLDIRLVWTLMVIVTFLNVVLSGTNILITHGRVRINNRRDSNSLRTALRSELLALRQATEINCALISDNLDYLVSLRAIAIVYKPSINRLFLLTDEETSALVEVYARIEQIDAVLCATAKVQGGLGYKLVKDETPRARISTDLNDVARLISVALDRLDGGQAAEQRQPMVGTTWRSQVGAAKVSCETPSDAGLSLMPARSATQDV